MHTPVAINQLFYSCNAPPAPCRACPGALRSTLTLRLPSPSPPKGWDWRMDVMTKTFATNISFFSCTTCPSLRFKLGEAVWRAPGRWCARTEQQWAHRPQTPRRSSKSACPVRACSSFSTNPFSICPACRAPERGEATPNRDAPCLSACRAPSPAQEQEAIRPNHALCTRWCCFRQQITTCA